MNEGINQEMRESTIKSQVHMVNGMSMIQFQGIFHIFDDIASSVSSILWRGATHDVYMTNNNDNVITLCYVCDARFKLCIQVECFNIWLEYKTMFIVLFCQVANDSFLLFKWKHILLYIRIKIKVTCSHIAR